jgi:hypothetical protein
MGYDFGGAHFALRSVDKRVSAHTPQASRRKATMQHPANPILRNPSSGRRLTLAAAAAAWLLVTPSLSHADAILNYVGQAFQATSEDAGTLTPPALYTTSDFVSGTIDLAAALGANVAFGSVTTTPTSFSFYDGVQTITNADATSSFFDFGTGASGNITQWFIQLEVTSVVGGPEVLEEGIGTSSETIGGSQDYGYQAVCTGPLTSTTGPCNPLTLGYDISAANDLPGVWSSPATTSVPEPATLALFGLGVAGVGFMRRRRKN